MTMIPDIKYESVRRIITEKCDEVVSRYMDMKHIKISESTIVEFMYKRRCVFCSVQKESSTSACSRCSKFVNSLDEKEAVAYSILMWEAEKIDGNQKRQMIRAWLSIPKNKRRVFQEIL